MDPMRPSTHLVKYLLPAALGPLLVAACGQGEATAPAPPPPQVTVVTLHEEPVTLTRVLPGRTSAFLVAEVRPQVGGIVRRRLFTEGSLVERGQALYELDDAVYRAEHDSARAGLERAASVLASARLTARRTAELREIDAVSAQENDDAVATLRAAEADVAAARAAVERAALDVRYARITSPIAGRIGRSTVTTGALVTANQPDPLATVQQLDPIYVDLTRSSTEWLRLRREIEAGRVSAGASDAPVGILLEDGTRHAHEGRLQFADVTVDESTGSFALRAIVPNPQNVLRPGMYVRAELVVGGASAAVLAPQQGITRDAKGGATALVVAGDGTVEQRSVTVSRTLGDRWLVEGGLAAGDRLIVEGLQKVRPGMPVEAVEATGDRPLPPPGAEAPAAAS